MAANKFKTGIFAAAALVLLGLMLFSFGLADLLVNKVPVETFFTESVQGLATGAPVKYKGVPVGTVRDIAIYVGEKKIRVDMDIELKVFKNAANEPMFRSNEEFRKFLQQEIRNGLRCRLDYAGITGMRYVELDYFDDPGVPVEVDDDSPIFTIPASPSVFKDVAKSLNTSLDRISRIRFEEISDSLVHNLADLNSLLASADLKGTLAHLKTMSANLSQTSRSVNEVVTAKRLEDLSTNLEKTLEEIRNLSLRLTAAVDAAQIGERSAAFRQAMTSVTDAADAVSAQRDSWQALQDKILDAAAALQELLDNLNADPGSLLRGRGVPPPEL